MVFLDPKVVCWGLILVERGEKHFEDHRGVLDLDWVVRRIEVVWQVDDVVE